MSTTQILILAFAAIGLVGALAVASIALLPTEINLQDIFSFGIMILILVFRPTGLFGTRVTGA